MFFILRKERESFKLLPSVYRNERQMLECSGIHFQHSLHQQSQVTDVTLGLKNTHRQWHMDSITNLINCHKDCGLRIMQLHQRGDVYSHNTSKSHAITHWIPLALLNLKSKVLVGYNCKLGWCYYSSVWLVTVAQGDKISVLVYITSL